MCARSAHRPWRTNQHVSVACSGSLSRMASATWDDVSEPRQVRSILNSPRSRFFVDLSAPDGVLCPISGSGRVHLESDIPWTDMMTALGESWVSPSGNGCSRAPDNTSGVCTCAEVVCRCRRLPFAWYVMCDGTSRSVSRGRLGKGYISFLETNINGHAGGPLS